MSFYNNYEKKKMEHKPETVVVAKLNQDRKCLVVIWILLKKIYTKLDKTN